MGIGVPLSFKNFSDLPGRCEWDYLVAIPLELLREKLYGTTTGKQKARCGERAVEDGVCLLHTTTNRPAQQRNEQGQHKIHQ